MHILTFHFHNDSLRLRCHCDLHFSEAQRGSVTHPRSHPHGPYCPFTYEDEKQSFWVGFSFREGLQDKDVYWGFLGTHRVGVFAHDPPGFSGALWGFGSLDKDPEGARGAWHHGKTAWPSSDHVCCLGTTPWSPSRPFVSIQNPTPLRLTQGLGGLEKVMHAEHLPTLGECSLSLPGVARPPCCPFSPHSSYSLWTERRKLFPTPTRRL